MPRTARSREWLPVWLSLLVWPGAGQMYQGRRVKGLALVTLSGLFGLAFVVLAALVILKALPADLALLDPLTLLGALREAVLDHLHLLTAVGLPLAAVWVYAALDAWRGQ